MLKPPQKSLRSLLLSALSGLLLTAAFPPGPFPFLAWIALVPLFMASQTGGLSQAFRWGFVAGFIHFLSLMYWITVVLGRYGNLNPVIAFSALVLISAYLALYVASFSFLTRRVSHHGLWVFLAPSFWVGLEYARTHLLTGFPWCLLGYSQYEQQLLIQMSDLFGVYGLSFLIVLINALLYDLFLRAGKRTTMGSLWKSAAGVVLLGAAVGYGTHCLSSMDQASREASYLRVAAVQGNMDQSIKWDPDYQEKTLQIYEDLTLSLDEFHPGLVVWPETAMPFFFQGTPQWSSRIIGLARESRASLIFGSPAFRETMAGGRQYLNRAYMIGTGPPVVQYYDKVHLVPFGEYVPLGRFLPFIDRLVQAAGDFLPGEKVVPVQSEGFSAGILICFEVIFPDLARTMARGGANLLVNITNDAWFGNTSAPYQHLSMAVFRSVENRKAMVRSANTGFSAFIEPTGAITHKSGLFTRETVKGTLPLSDGSLTWYARYGDVFAGGLLLLTMGFAVVLLWTDWRKRGKGA